MKAGNVPDARSKSRWWVLAAVLIPVLMGPLDASVVNVSMPTLARRFGVGPDTVSWVSLSYLLVTSSSLLSFGRLGDMFGFRRMFLIGVGVFASGSVLCGFSRNIATLIACRAFQAVGAGITAALAPGIITAGFPAGERGKALGMQGMAVGLGLVVGPGLGGMLLESLGVGSVFFINVPVALLAFLACYRLLPEDDGFDRGSFDGPGALLGFLCLACLVFAVTKGKSSFAVPAAFISLSAGYGFVMHEKRVRDQALRLELFRSRAFSAGNSAALFHFITQYMVVFTTTFYLQRGLGLSPSRSGLCMIAFPLVSMVVAPLSGALSDKMGKCALSFTGAVLCSLGALCLGWALPQSSSGALWRLASFGLGTGMFQSPNNSAVMGAAPKEHLGVAGAVLATARNVGMVVGTGVAGGTLASRELVYARSGLPLPQAAAAGDVYLGAAAASLMCIVCVLCQGNRIRCLGRFQRDPGDP